MNSMQYIFVTLCVFMYSLLSLGGQTINVITRNPMPSSLAEWQRDRSLIQVIIINPAGSEAKPNCYLGYVLKDALTGKVLAQSDNSNPSIPRFSLPSGPSTVTRFGNQVINENSSLFDASIRTQILTTNTIPEGSYDFCVTLFDERGTALGELGTLCRFFSVTIPDPPTLIAPQHEQMIDKVLLPVFSWTPVITTSINSLYYAIKICPVFEGQNDRFALDNNPVLHENKRITSTTYMYPPSGLHFSTFAGAIGFVWQVQALQSNGIPATRNNGKSEIYRFTLKERIKSVEKNGNIDSESGNSLPQDSTGVALRNDDKDSKRNSLGASYTTVKIGEHIVTLTKPQRCDNYCVINGQAKALTPFYSDSLLFSMQGLEVRNINNQLIAVKGRIVHEWQKKAFMFTSVSLMPKSIIISPIGNVIEGTVTIDWSAVGLRGVSASIPYTSQWDDKGTVKTSTVIDKRFTLDNKEDNCIHLQCDTLITSLEFTQPVSLNAILTGSLNNVCTSDGVPHKLGSVTLPIDEPNPENLLFVLPNSSHKLSINGTPIQLSTEEIWVDFSSDVNFSGVSVQPQCAASRATNPLWKGIILPKAGVQCTISDMAISFIAQDILLESTSYLRVSFMASAQIQQKISVGDFKVTIDSMYISLCNNNPIEARFPSFVSIQESGYSIPTNWLIFKQLPLTLYFDGAWKLYGHRTLENTHVTFGDFTRLLLSTVVLRKQKNKYVIDFVSNKIRYSPKVNNLINFPDFSLTDGTVTLRSGQWMQLPQKYSTFCESFSVTIDEVGVGYEDDQFWVGWSGVLIPPDESGLLPFPVNKVKIYESKNHNVVSLPTQVNMKIGGAIRADFTLVLSYVSDEKTYGITGQGVVELPWLSERKIPSSLVYSVKDALHFWHLNGFDFQEKGIGFLQDCDAPILSFSAGWNTDVEDIREDELRTILQDGGVLPRYSNYRVKEHPLFAKGVLLLHDSNQRLFSSLLNYQYSSGTSEGMLGALINASGHIVWYPTLGFASGNISSQWSSRQKSRDISFVGSLTLLMPEKAEANSKLVLSRSGSMKASIGPFNGVIRGLSSTTSQTKEIVSMLECSQSFWDITTSSLSLRGKLMSFAGISGIPEDQKRPISLVQIASGPQTCTDMILEHNDRSTSLSMKFGSNNATQYASFDVLPCLHPLGLLSFRNVQKTFDISAKKIVFSSESEQTDCRSMTYLSVPGIMRAATTIQLKGETQNVSVKIGDKSLTIPGMKLPVQDISGLIEGSYLQKNLLFNSGMVSPLQCAEKSEYGNNKMSNRTYNIASSLERGGCIVNRGKTLPKGMSLILEVALNENGRIFTKKYPIKLQTALLQDDEVTLQTLLPKEKFNQLVKVSIRFVSVKETDMSDNCVSVNTELCE